jgi:hypothetical protein
MRPATGYLQLAVPGMPVTARRRLYRRQVRREFAEACRRRGGCDASQDCDLSARSSIIEAEPFGLHFWECTPKEFLTYLKDPRGFLASMGIKLPKNCRIETTIENHDWLSANTRKLAADNGPVIVCNVGGGNVAVTRNIYRVVSYAHTHDAIGKFKKTLLHSRNEQERKSK